MQYNQRMRRRPVVASSGGGADSFGNPDQWHYIGDSGEPAFENGFIGITNSGLFKPGFRKVGDYLEIVGLFVGAASTTMFTLPVGFRPVTTIFSGFAIAVDLTVGGADNAFDGIRINTDGTVLSGANIPGYGAVLWSVPPGIFFPLTPPEAGT
jgi:hypothetical protein